MGFGRTWALLVVSALAATMDGSAVVGGRAGELRKTASTCITGHPVLLGIVKSHTFEAVDGAEPRLYIGIIMLENGAYLRSRFLEPSRELS